MAHELTTSCCRVDLGRDLTLGSLILALFTLRKELNGEIPGSGEILHLLKAGAWELNPDLYYQGII